MKHDISKYEINRYTLSKRKKKYFKKKSWHKNIDNMFTVQKELHKNFTSTMNQTQCAWKLTRNVIKYHS